MVRLICGIELRGDYFLILCSFCSGPSQPPALHSLRTQPQETGPWLKTLWVEEVGRGLAVTSVN